MIAETARANSISMRVKPRAERMRNGRLTPKSRVPSFGFLSAFVIRLSSFGFRVSLLSDGLRSRRRAVHERRHAHGIILTSRGKSHFYGKQPYGVLVRVRGPRLIAQGPAEFPNSLPHGSVLDGGAPVCGDNV